MGLAGLLIAWSTLAVGGVYTWASVPIILMAVGLVARLRPGVARRPDTRVLDVALLAALAATCLQVLPLPNGVRWALSPRIDVDRLTLLLMPDAASSWRPVTLDAAATLMAVALIAAALAMFWSCRHLCGRGHSAFLVDTVAFVGLVGAVAAIVQRAVEPTLIYGLWAPLDAGARPFGPFVNRNHFGTWLLMALPLSAGGLATSLHLARAAPRGSARVAAGLRALETRRGWIAVSIAIMLLTLVLTSSRSALAGASAGLVLWCALGYTRATRRGVALGLGAAVILGLIVVGMAPPQPLLARVQETLALGSAGRSAIWKDAAEVGRAYPIVGTGLGTFERAMLIYQTGDRRTRTNQAHNQYLHLWAEGGALVAVPTGLACLAFLALAARRLREDVTPGAWLRIGSLAGILGVAVQGAWETGLRMPANGVLLAVVAAIAVHRPPRPPG